MGSTTSDIDTDNSRTTSAGLSERFVTKKIHKVGDKCESFLSGRIKQALSNPAKKLSFLVGPAFFFGSLLFVIGAAAQLDVTYWQDKWPKWQQLAFVDGPFLAGALLFLLGACISFLEAANAGVSHAWQLWNNRGRNGPRPRISLTVWPSQLQHELISFHGTLLQYAGAIVFAIGTSTELTGTVSSSTSSSIRRWLLSFQYLLGGALFTAGAFLLAAEGSHSWWRGLLPPLRGVDARSINHWIEFLNWAGSLLFLLGGAAEWRADVWSPGESVAVTAVTWLAGSIVFLLQGALLYLETVNPAW